jgi:hypothetical protein
MSYATTTIGSLLPDVNQRYFLPAIQRPYVWGPDQVVALIDSLLKGYPLGPFMFWSVDDALKRELAIYNFIEHWKPGMQNTLTSADGRDVVLVLDGQQRMTSLLIALRGTFAEKAKFKRRSSFDAWSAKTLYLNLIKDPTTEGEDGDAELGVTFGLRFHAHPPRNDHRHFWFRVGDILNYPDVAQLEGVVSAIDDKLHHSVVSFERELMATTLRRLHQAIWIDEAVNFFTETSSSVDRVLDIFVRANDGGVKLSKSDLLMSMITSKWANGSAREEVYGFVDFINSRLGQPNRINKDFVLKACLVLCGFDVKYNVSNFTTHAITEIEARWPEIKNAIERTFRFLNGLGISEENLTSLNAVLPICWYLFRDPSLTLRGTSVFDQQNARAVQRWLVNTLLMGTFAGNSDLTLATARATLHKASETSRDFPETALYHALAIGGRLTQLDERAIDGLFEQGYDNSRRRGKLFLALSLVYEGLDWAGTAFQIDHIIPQARTERPVLMGSNLPEDRIREITGAVNRLGNLQLLSEVENREKSDLPFEAWITSRADTYRQQHLIGDTQDLWSTRMLPEFVRYREQLIRRKLLSLTAPGAV